MTVELIGDPNWSSVVTLRLIVCAVVRLTVAGERLIEANTGVITLTKLVALTEPFAAMIVVLPMPTVVMRPLIAFTVATDVFVDV